MLEPKVEIIYDQFRRAAKIKDAIHMTGQVRSGQVRSGQVRVFNMHIQSKLLKRTPVTGTGRLSGTGQSHMTRQECINTRPVQRHRMVKEITSAESRRNRAVRSFPIAATAK